MSKNIKIGIVGAGIQGVSNALFLQKKGFKVTIFDRDNPGAQAASYGIAGHFSPYASVPINRPDVLTDVPAMLMSSSGPLALKWNYVPKMIPWFMKFILNTTKNKILMIKNISEFLELDLVTTLATNESYFQYDKDGLSFVVDSSNPRSLLHVDFLKGKLGWRLKRAQHEGNLKKALGKKDKKLFIFDATAGLLSDTMIFLSLGHKVVAVEQSKILFCLVNDAIQRARDKIPHLNNLEFLNDNSLLAYKKQNKVFDAIYLDPMYPIIKKSTKKRGSINSIKQILEFENLLSDEKLSLIHI